jgi:hypothetical protein
MYTYFLKEKTAHAFTHCKNPVKNKQFKMAEARSENTQISGGAGRKVKI